MQLEEKLQNSMERRLTEARHRLELCLEKIRGLSPLEKLNQGFAYVTNEAGQPVRDIENTAIHDRLHIRMRNGEICAEVLKKEKKEWR